MSNSGDSSLEYVFSDVRMHLNDVYVFKDSRRGLYIFDPHNPDPQLSQILAEVGMKPEDIQAKLEEYRTGDVGGTCVYTRGNGGFDYVVLLPAGNASCGDWALRIGEEINHGEHGTEHDGNHRYIEKFSPIAREFIGGSGRCHVARKVCVIPPGKLLPEGFPASKATYDGETDTFHFDIVHAVGYELARGAIGGEIDWQRAMFHAPDDNTLWGLYNDVMVPDIKITVPQALENKEQLIREISEHVSSSGLRHNIGFSIDETDTGGMNL
ncbi:MAG: hypothetical protein JXC85_06010 [Candidatus Aenigmarchaeota archaeon]|nr:hypothetical protein [Candidatus Aenigmarchaeota archaeon]